MPAEAKVCYLRVTFKDSPHGSLIKIMYRSDQGILNTIDTLLAQYLQQGQDAKIEVLSEEDGDQLVKGAVLAYPLWQDLVEAGQLTPMVFAN